MFEILFYIRYANHKDEKACVWGRGLSFMDMSARCFLTPSFGELVKNLHYKRTRSLKPWPPPPSCSGHSNSRQVIFHMYKYICFWKKCGLKWMILKQKKIWFKGKISIYKNKYWDFFLFQNILRFFEKIILRKKKLKRGRGLSTHPHPP